MNSILTCFHTLHVKGVVDAWPLSARLLTLFFLKLKEQTSPTWLVRGAPYQGSSPLSLRLTCISRTQDTKSWLPLNSCHCPLFFSFWLLVFTSHLMIWLLHSDRSPETCLKIDGASESCDFPPKRTSTTHPPQNSVHTQITLFQLGTELLILQVGFQVCEGCSVHGFLWFTEQSSRDCNENLGCWSSGSRTVQCLT